MARTPLLRLVQRRVPQNAKECINWDLSQESDSPAYNDIVLTSKSSTKTLPISTCFPWILHPEGKPSKARDFGQYCKSVHNNSRTRIMMLFFKEPNWRHNTQKLWHGKRKKKERQGGGSVHLTPLGKVSTLHQQLFACSPVLNVWPPLQSRHPWLPTSWIFQSCQQRYPLRSTSQFPLPWSAQQPQQFCFTK